tara:strand:+ start:118 stop:849 length:732 start_codon:yes stop_codon:yes gene_type:complete
MKIVVLAEFGGELSLEYIRELLQSNIKVDSIVFIGDKYDTYRKQLVIERTKGRYTHLEFLDIIKGRTIKCYFVEEVNSQWCEMVLSMLGPDVVVSGCTKIIKRPVYNIPNYGMLNCHSGLIQKYRGCSCVEWAIYNDDIVGSSCHLIDKGIDTGSLVYQSALKITENDSYSSVRAKMIKHQAVIMRKGVESLLDNQTDFARKVEKGDYYKPMRDDKLLERVISILEEKRYSHYNLPNSTDISI